MNENEKPQKKGIIENMLHMLFGHESNETESTESTVPTVAQQVPASSSAPAVAPSPQTLGSSVAAPQPISERKRATQEVLEMLGLRERKRSQRIGVSGYKIIGETELQPVQIIAVQRDSIAPEKPKKSLAQKIKFIEKRKGKKLSKKELLKLKQSHQKSAEKTMVAPAKTAFEEAWELSAQVREKNNPKKPERAQGTEKMEPKPVVAGEKSSQKLVPAVSVEKQKPSAELQPIDGAVSDIEEQEFYTKEMMKNLEKEFYRQHVTEQEFRQKMLDYRQQMHFFEVRKKKLGEMKSKGETKVEKQSPIEVNKLGQSTQPKDWKQMIESKATGKVNEQKLKELETRMEGTLEKYKIPKKELEKEIASLNESQLLGDFDKLINLLELEHQTKQFQQTKKEKIETVEPEKKNAKDEIKAIAIELQKHRIITELDKIVELVKLSGKVSVHEISRKLGMKRQNVMNWCQTLEESGVIRIDYPPLGDPIVFDKNYIELPKVRGGKK